MVQWYLGVPDQPVKPAINSSTWRMSMQTAAEFRKGCVLRGRRRGPPVPAYGRLRSQLRGAGRPQPGVEARVVACRGLAGDALLDTYDAERRPVVDANAAFSFGNSLRMEQVDQAARSGDPGPLRVLGRRPRQPPPQRRSVARVPLRARRRDRRPLDAAPEAALASTLPSERARSPLPARLARCGHGPRSRSSWFEGPARPRDR